MTLNAQENIHPPLKDERCLEEIKENLNEKNHEKSFVSNASHSKIKKSKTTFENSVIHTSIAETNKTESGKKKINQYTFIKELGRYHTFNHILFILLTVGYFKMFIIYCSHNATNCYLNF